jgi:hypothetical protein
LANLEGMSFQETAYRGYTLTVVFLPPWWRVAIIPSKSNLPRVPSHEAPVLGKTHDEVLVLARSRVDDLLNEHSKR